MASIVARNVLWKTSKLTNRLPQDSGLVEPKVNKIDPKKNDNKMPML